MSPLDWISKVYLAWVWYVPLATADKIMVFCDPGKFNKMVLHNNLNGYANKIYVWFVIHDINGG